MVLLPTNLNNINKSIKAVKIIYIRNVHEKIRVH